MRKSLVLATAFLSICTAAMAHPQLKLAGPAPGSAVTTPPKTIRIKFSEGFELALTGLELKDGAGMVHQTGAASIDPKDKTVLVVPVSETLPSGTYTVNWHAVGDDTHHQEGHYSFEVKS